MVETYTQDELLRRVRRARRLSTTMLILAVCSFFALIGVAAADLDPILKAVIGSPCPLLLAAYVAANTRREYWLLRLLKSLQ
jgi:hypothetical protein